jgi:hypothetical protein
MSDHSAEIELLGDGYQNLFLNEDSMDLILSHIDCFVSQSRGNESVEEVYVHPYASFDGHDDDVWEKFGQAIGNLQKLENLHIRTPDDHDDDEVVAILNWEILARILSHVRQRITLSIFPRVINSLTWRAEDSRSLARVIHGHPTITGFKDNGELPYESLDTLYSALATLPALEDIRLSKCKPSTRPEDESTLVNPKILTELLRVPTLRFVDFHCFYFTRDLCQATANALMEGMAVTNLEFWNCSFSSEECAEMMANGLGRNTSLTCIEVKYIDVVPPWGGTLYHALAKALPVNSTLQELYLKVFSADDDPAHVEDWSPILLAVGKNLGLKTLKVDMPYSMDESLCKAMQNGLGMNETLERLELNYFPMRDDNAALWCRALSFLRTNKALKSLIIRLDDDMMRRSCVPAFHIDIAAMLQENASLESICIQSWGDIEINAEEYLVLITMLQHNKTLKSLNVLGCHSLTLTHDEDKQMAALLQKNYALESLPDMNLEIEAGDVGAILRLNKTGRRYLIEDGSSVSKGVKVLSAVRSDINCVFLHLLENPRLCDRSAVEAASDSTDNSGGSTSSVNQIIGKREHGQAQIAVTEDKEESRRRLT